MAGERGPVTTSSLTFDSPDELMAFHAELGTLMREVTIAASGSSTDPELATARAREVLAEFATITTALNAIRASGVIQRSAG